MLKKILPLQNKMRMKKPKLVVGEEYQVELYPSGEKRSAKYLGVNEKDHIFSIQEEKDIAYVILNDHWIIEAEGFLTYKPISSASVDFKHRSDLERYSDLLEKLNELERNLQPEKTEESSDPFGLDTLLFGE